MPHPKPGVGVAPAHPPPRVYASTPPWPVLRRHASERGGGGNVIENVQKIRYAIFNQVASMTDEEILHRIDFGETINAE